MKKKIPVEELEFCRALIATRADGTVETSFIVQPYCVGMYVAVTIPGRASPVQLTFNYKELVKWVKGSIKKMQKNGLTISTTYHKLVDYFSEHEIEQYILK